MIFTLVIIAVMTTICVLGTELSALFQRVLIFAQVGALLLFAVVALVKGGALTSRAVLVLARSRSTARTR